MRKLTAPQAIALDVLYKVLDENNVIDRVEISNEDLDELESFVEGNYYDIYDDYLDALNDFRCSGEVTNISPENSRYFESKSRARKLTSGKWVGWTYWYGGGKHDRPSEMDWLGNAYYLKEPTPKIITVYEFEKEDSE